MSSLETTWRPFLAVPAYIAVLLLAALTCSWFGVIPQVEEMTLLRFDAIHYRGIMQEGYANESSAFFPLFPMTWKYSGLGPIGISVFNGCLFIVCTLLLIKEFGTSWLSALLFVSLPSVFFLFVPYSESVFFVGAAGLLIAVRRDMTWLSAVSLIVCTLARPAFTALLPALLITVMLGPVNSMRKARKVLIYVSASALAMLVVIMVQYQQTGDYFGFYKAQESFGNTFGLPDLPLSSWGGGSVVRLDAVALLSGVIAAVLLVRITIKRILGSSISYDPELILSLGYVAGISAIALLLRNGELFSLNRFVFATPFALVLLSKYAEHPMRMDLRRSLLIFLALNLYFLLFASFVHIQTFLLFNLVAVYLVMVMYVAEPLQNKRRPLFWIWCIAALALQLFYLQRYLSDMWVA
jgi:hypothetical protein